MLSKRGRERSFLETSVPGTGETAEPRERGRIIYAPWRFRRLFPPAPPRDPRPHCLVISQNTGTGATSMPATLARIAEGWK